MYKVILNILILFGVVFANAQNPVAEELGKLNEYFTSSDCFYLDVEYLYFTEKDDEYPDKKKMFVAMQEGKVYNKVDNVESLKSDRLTLIVDHDDKRVTALTTFKQTYMDNSATQVFSQIEQLLSSCDTAIVSELKSDKSNISLHGCQGEYSQIDITYFAKNYEPSTIILHGENGMRLEIYYTGIDRQKKDKRMLLDKSRFVNETKNSIELNSTNYNGYTFENYYK